MKAEPFINRTLLNHPNSECVRFFEPGCIVLKTDETHCSIPKKPDWKGSENASEFKQLETKTFLDWKRRLAKLQNKHPNLPPFEKNLDFWRQLWKIVELSDVVVQVK